MGRLMQTRSRISELVVLIVLHASATQAGDTIQIKLAHPVPSGTVWDKALEEMGAEWQEATGGAVRLNIFAGGVAGPDDTVIRKLRLGQLHAASLGYGGLNVLDDAFEIFQVPLFFDSYEEFFYVLDKLEPVLRQRLDAKGMVLLSWGLGGWVYVFSREPIHEVSDVKHMKMFTAAGDSEMVQIFRRNGFKPVALDATDMMSGLQTGMFDALPTTPLIALAFHCYRTIGYMHEFGLGPVIGATVITQKAWDGVPEQHRATLVAAAKRAETRLRVEIPSQELDAVHEMRRRGLRVIQSSDPLEWTQETNRLAVSMRGTIVPADIFDQALNHRNAYRQRILPAGIRAEKD